MGHILH